MQSEAWSWQDDPPAQKAFDAVYDWVLEQITDNDGNPDGIPEGCPNPNAPTDSTTGLTDQQSQVATAPENTDGCTSDPPGPGDPGYCPPIQ